MMFDHSCNFLNILVIREGRSQTLSGIGVDCHVNIVLERFGGEVGGY